MSRIADQSDPPDGPGTYRRPVHDIVVDQLARRSRGDQLRNRVGPSSENLRYGLLFVRGMPSCRGVVYREPVNAVLRQRGNSKTIPSPPPLSDIACLDRCRPRTDSSPTGVPRIARLPQPKQRGPNDGFDPIRSDHNVRFVRVAVGETNRGALIRLFHSNAFKIVPDHSGRQKVGQSTNEIGSVAHADERADADFSLKILAGKRHLNTTAFIDSYLGMIQREGDGSHSFPHTKIIEGAHGVRPQTDPSPDLPQFEGALIERHLDTDLL